MPSNADLAPISVTVVAVLAGVHPRTVRRWLGGRPWTVEAARAFLRERWRRGIEAAYREQLRREGRLRRRPNRRVVRVVR